MSTLTKFSLLKRRADLSVGQFSAHWRHTHVDVLVEQGGHKRYNRHYVQNHFIHGEHGSDGAPAAFDGAAQMVPHDAGVVTRGFQEDPLYQQFVRPDELKFLDVPRCVVLYCESRVVLEDPAPGAFKLLLVVRRPPGQTHPQFLQAWREQHTGRLLEQPDVRRFVCGCTEHVVLQDATRGMAQGEKGLPAMAYDGVAEWRFKTLSDLRAALSSPAWQTHHARTFGPGSQAFVAHAEPIYGDPL